MRKTYLVECFWSGITQAAHANAVARAADAARTLCASGRDVRFIDGLLVPADEVAFYRFAAAAIDDVERVSVMAQLRPERILEYIETLEVTGDAPNIHDAQDAAASSNPDP